MVVGDLRRTGARAVVMTPAHQYPTGAVLSARRRAELATWARDVDGVVIEDDYDAEYRYDRHPIGALQGVAPEHVIYGGTLSQGLAPGLRLGWLVLPPALVDRVITTREMTGMASATLSAGPRSPHFLSHGDLDRHLRRTRRVYRQRRDTLIDALARHFPEATPSGIAAGLHLLVSLPAGSTTPGWPSGRWRRASASSAVQVPVPTGAGPGTRPRARLRIGDAVTDRTRRAGVGRAGARRRLSPLR